MAAGRKLVFVLLGICSSCVVLGEAGRIKKESTEYYFGVMELTIPGRGDEKICLVYPHEYYDLDPFTALPYKLLDFSEIDLCRHNLTGNDLPPSGNFSLFVLSARSNCTVQKQFSYIKKKGAGLVLLSNYTYSLNESYGMEIFVIVSDSLKFESLNLTHLDVTAKLFGGKGFNFSTLVLWGLAIFCILVGSSTGVPSLNLTTVGLVRTEGLEDGGGDKEETNTGEQVNFSLKLILLMVTFITTTLLLLYFFFKYLVYVFIAIFCFASARATYNIFKQVLAYFGVRLNIYKIRSVDVGEIFLGLVAMSIPVVWFVFRHRPITSAVLQDTLGVFFCINMIQTLRIPNLKWCTTLLSMLFVYDIVMVFITPYFTWNGESIMGAVATGGSGSGTSGGEAPEQLPLLLKVPQLGRLSSCSGPSLLGFGDIIVPGLLTGFAYSFDKLKGNRFRPYFASTSVGYVLGLTGAFVALFLTSMGQPALLYIVPATLIMIFSVGLWRKEVGDLWRGIDSNQLPS